MFFFTDAVLFLSQWFEDKLQEVENEEQHLRKLHAVVDSLVNHRKGERCVPLSSSAALAVKCQLHGLFMLFPVTKQNCVGTRQYLPKVWPCWGTRRTTRPCPGRCPSWQRWRTRWSSCIRSRQPVTSSSSKSCWPTTSACWEP